MTLSPADIEALKRLAIEQRGPAGWIGGLSTFACLMGLVLMAVFAFEGHFTAALVAAGVAVVGLLGAIITGRMHEQAYAAGAARAGLSPAEAKALADQADVEQGD